MSMSVPPAPSPSAIPFRPSAARATSSPVGSMVIAKSAFPAASAGLAATVPPVARAAPSSRSGAVS